MLEALCGNCGGRAESWEAVYHDPVCPSRVAAQTERALRAEAASYAAEHRAADLAERLAGVERERDQVREAAERPWWQRWLRPD
jgi:hypothetical protein